MSGARSSSRFATERASIALLIIGVLWSIGVAAGTVGLARYASTPGTPAAPPEVWPEGSSLLRAPGRAALILLAHPRCPCTRASIGELAAIMARAGSKVTAHVVFMAPEGVDEGWGETDLRERAAAIPGVMVHDDVRGIEAARFRASTSGETIVYGSDGRLRFRGGITAARGHAGDNPGRSRALAVLLGAATERAESPVFGCALSDAEPSAR